MGEVHEIHTTCGKVIRMTVPEMSTTQIASLIKQKPGNDALPEMNAELARHLNLHMEAA